MRKRFGLIAGRNFRSTSSSLFSIRECSLLESSLSVTTRFCTLLQAKTARLALGRPTLHADRHRTQPSSYIERYLSYTCSFTRIVDSTNRNQHHSFNISQTTYVAGLKPSSASSAILKLLLGAGATQVSALRALCSKSFSIFGGARKWRKAG